MYIYVLPKYRVKKLLARDIESFYLEKSTWLSVCDIKRLNGFYIAFMNYIAALTLKKKLL